MPEVSEQKECVVFASTFHGDRLRLVFQHKEDAYRFCKLVEELGDVIQARYQAGEWKKKRETPFKFTCETTHDVYILGTYTREISEIVGIETLPGPSRNVPIRIVPCAAYTK